MLEIDEGNAVSIKQIELAIAARGWDEGWIVPQPPAARSGRTVAVVGSGPAGLACAQQLNRAGHLVTVFERDEAGGGLLRFGVPDFKIDKERRRAAPPPARRGGRRRSATAWTSGATSTRPSSTEGFDAVVLAVGSRVPRDLPIPGRELDGVHFAMEYLYQRNRAVAGSAAPAISAAGKHVIVVGGGDTGADCVASAHRERAASVTQIELLGEPPASRPDDLTPWPLWPMKLRTSYALKEGGERSFAISTTALAGTRRVERIDWMRNSGAPPFEPVPGSEESHPAELVLLAMGFVGPEPALLEQLGVETDPRGNADAAEFATSVRGVFAAGDARRGQSLVVWAIDEGRRCARAVDAWLATAPARPRLARRAPLSPAPLRD